jgi:hypothetical protein
MALPQNPQGVTNTDRILLEAVNAQTQNLQGQTKVLHTVSDRLMKQNKEFQGLRKDMQEMGKTLLQGQGSNLAEIKKYFEKNKSNFRERPNVGNNSNKNSDDKGFFRNMIGKLFGPSKYQQKMMDDTSQILSLTELVSSDIGFIREKYSDSARAKERELLATAIAERINNAGGGEGGGLFKGLLTAVAGLGSVLAMGIGSAISGLITGIAGLAGSIVSAIAALAAPIGTAIGAVLSGILAGIKYVLEKLAQAFGIDDIDTPGKRRPSASSSSGGIPPVVVSPDGKPVPPGSPVPNQQRLPGPGRNIPRLPNPGVEDIPYRDIPKGGSSAATPSGAGGVLNVLKSAIKAVAIGGTIYAIGDALFNTSPEDIETLKRGERLRNNGASTDSARQTDELRNRSRAIQKENSNGGAKAIPGMFSESGDTMVKGADGKYYPTWSDAILAQGTNFLDDAQKNLGDGIKKWVTEAISNIDEFVNPMVDKAVAFVDEAFQIPINVNGKTEMLDLAPGLGTATAKVLKDIASETADLVGAGMDKAGDVITQINNNNNQTASAPMPFSAATPKSVHEATMDLYKIYYGKIR